MMQAFFKNVGSARRHFLVMELRWIVRLVKSPVSLTVSILKNEK